MMNNGFNNIPNNNYGINNNNNNLNYNNSNDNNGNNSSNILFIGVIVLLIIGIGAMLYLLIGVNRAEKNLEEELKKEPTISENKKEEEVQKPQQPTPEEPKPENNQSSQQNNQSTQQNNNTQTTKKSSMKCVGTAKDEYATYSYNYNYSFSSDGKMKKAVSQITVTLNKSSVGYRDSMIQSFKNENKKFVKLDGISESISKKSNGFTYTMTIDASKLSAKELASMGYRTLNYTGVKMRAKELGLTCS